MLDVIRSSSHFARALAFVAPAFAFACASPAQTECAAEQQQRLVLRDGALQYDAREWSNAVVRLQIETGPRERRSVNHCSGAVIAAGVVLSAAHCFRVDEASLPIEIGIARSGPVTSTCDGGTTISRAGEYRVHPQLDVALVYFEDTSLGAFPLLGGPLPLDATVVMAGFGLNADSVVGEFSAAQAKVEEVAELIRVRGESAGACVGDSGGPLVVVDASVATVAGTLTAGAASCAGHDYYVPTASLRRWLDDNVPDARWQ